MSAATLLRMLFLVISFAINSTTYYLSAPAKNGMKRDPVLRRVWRFGKGVKRK